MPMSKSRLAGLTTRGRCLLAAGIAAGACGLILDERDLLRVAVFVVALPLLALLLTALAKIGMAVSRAVRPPRVPVGQTAEAGIMLHRLGRVPAAGLLLEDAVPDAVRPEGTPRFVLDSFSARGSRALRYELRPTLRGIHPVGPMRVRVSDPFGLAEYDRELPGQTRLVVTPRIEPLTGIPGTAGGGAGASGEAASDEVGRAYPGHGADDGSVRQYRHGDDLRRVHWRSTAHRDELMVRAEEQPVRSGTTLVLDNRRSAHAGTGADSSLEWAISFAASVYCHLHEQGQRVHLTTDEGVPVTGQYGIGDAGTGGAAPTVVLDALAALRPSHRRDLGYRDGHQPDGETLAVLATMGPLMASRFGSTRSTAGGGSAVLLDTSSWSGDPGSAGNTDRAADALAHAGWRVVVAHRGDAVAHVWRTLLAQPAGLAPGRVVGNRPAPEAGVR